MIFESEYRRQALSLWDDKKQTVKQEIVDHTTAFRSKIALFNQHAKNLLLSLIPSSKRPFS